jgi:hypothetical protein
MGICDLDVIGGLEISACPELCSHLLTTPGDPLPTTPGTLACDGPIFEYDFWKRKSFKQAEEYCNSFGDGTWTLPKPGSKRENDEIVQNVVSKYTTTAQEVWIDVLHRDGQWNLNGGYANWASPDKAADPEEYGDAALIKTGTKSEPNGKWKQSYSSRKNNKGRVVCVRRLPCDVAVTTPVTPPVHTPDVALTTPEPPKPTTGGATEIVGWPLPDGGCYSQSDELSCAKNCAGQNFGRSMVTREHYGRNHWVYKAIGSNSNTYSKNDNRYLFRIDKSQCSEKIMLALAKNKVSFDVMDGSQGLMVYEATYANFDKSVGLFHKQCKSGRRGLYFQFSRNRAVMQEGDTDLMNEQKTKDWFYLVVSNITGLSKLGIKENDLHKCIEKTKVGLVKESKAGKDYTKCWAYGTCKIEPDW